MKGATKMIALHLGDKNNPKNDAHISIYMTSIEYERCASYMLNIISLLNENKRNIVEEEFLSIKKKLAEINNQMDSCQGVLETEKIDAENRIRDREENPITSIHF